MGDNRNLLAGTSAAGADGLGLIWMAATGSTAPSDGSSALAAAWKNMGGIAETGITVKQATSTVKKKFYGSPAVQRTLVTDQEYTIDVSYGETNARVIEVAFRKALNSITPTAVTGAFATTAGTYVRQLYALVADMVDGVNRMRLYFPSVEVTGQGDIKVANSADLQWQVTLSAYPDTSGNAIYPYFIVPSLG
jgi:hypothetical protein